MTTRRILILAGLLASVATTAGAASLTLYEGPNLSGRELTLNRDTRNIDRAGFNDRASSMAVQSGTWEVCTDVDFGGFCGMVGPGNYPMLDARFNNRISSAREAVPATAERRRPRDEAVGAIELYARPDFRGRKMDLDRDTANLADTGYNARARSVVVTAGTWELCSAPSFGGTCMTYEPGRYAALGNGSAREISSARLVATRVQPPAPTGDARIVLYERRNADGRSVAISADVPDLRRMRFDDQAASVVIEAGRWELCTGAGYRGECQVMEPGEYPRLDRAFSRSISSLRAVREAPVVQQDRRRGPDVELFESWNFTGSRFVTERDVPDLDVRGFNDKARSMIINEGQWEMCVDGGFNGRCTVFSPGRYPDLGGLTTEISSLRRVR